MRCVVCAPLGARPEILREESERIVTSWKLPARRALGAALCLLLSRRPIILHQTPCRVLGLDPRRPFRWRQCCTYCRRAIGCSGMFDARRGGPPGGGAVRGAVVSVVPALLLIAYLGISIRLRFAWKRSTPPGDCDMCAGRVIALKEVCDHRPGLTDSKEGLGTLLMVAPFRACCLTLCG